jgi:integrase
MEHSTDIGGMFPAATPASAKKRGPTMSRRGGQTGRIEKAGKNWYARFWLDDTQTGKRRYACVRICPVSGPGALNFSQRKRRCMEIIAESGANSEQSCREAKGAFLGTTFEQQSAAWLASLETRKRRPVKPNTLVSFRSALAYINPRIGGTALADFKNAQLKQFIGGMATDIRNERPRFAPKSISNYIHIVKSVIASAIDSDGEQLFPRSWNADFLDCPTIREQNTPCFSTAEIEAVLLQSGGSDYFFLYALLAGTGLRVGEAFALQIEDIQGSVIHVHRSLWNGRIGSPKTDAGVRDVDIPASLSGKLTELIGSRKTGYLFENAAGRPFSQSNVLHRSLHPILEALGLTARGFHAFRRYRVTHLRKQRVPEDLLMFWIGHEPRSVTDGYSMLKDDVEYRQMVAEKAGLGFTLEPKLHELHEIAVPVTC